jgi:hypothetical protein
MTRPLAIILLCVIAPGLASGAELAMKLPLGPYFRPGKYLPVHVTAVGLETRGNKWIGVATNTVNGRLEVGKGAGRTTVEAIGGRVDAVVPWLVLDGRAKRPRLFAEEPFESADGPELRELAPAERLVGWTSADDAFARELLGPEAQVIAVALDPAAPIVGPVAAWEALDALILDEASGARLDQAQIATLVACGTIVAVRTDKPPFPAWPWRRVGAYAVLRFAAAGPAETVSDAAYAPVADWQAGWPLAFRRRVVVIACVCCVLLFGLALWRPPLTAIWAPLLAGLMILFVGKWLLLYQPVQQAAGQVVVIDRAAGLTQTDGWTYQTAARDTEATLKWIETTRPVPATRNSLDDVFVTLNCKTSGEPSEFLTRLPANRRLAFRSRSVGPRAPQAKPDPLVRSPLAGMVDQLYATSPAARVTGQLDLTSQSGPAYGKVEVQQWNAVVVER